MAWQTEMVTIVRYMISDLDQLTPTYSNERLIELIVVAAQLVQQELNFSQNFVADVDALTIVPDPTLRLGPSPSRDDSFINLTCMKAACVVDRQETKAAATQAIDIRDDVGAVSLGGAARARLRLLEISWCKAYEDTKLAYLTNKTHIAGAAIMSPFRVWAGDGRTIWPNLGYVDFR